MEYLRKVIKVNKGKCKICGRITYLEKHHYIPQRVMKTDHYVYICSDCHRKVHPENEIIINAKFSSKYNEAFHKFIKENYPEAWKKWIPLRKKIRAELKEKYEKEPIPFVGND